MPFKVKYLTRVGGHLLFCLFIIAFFGNFCTLRIASCQHIYKEYLSGVIVLMIVYANYFVLFPRYYEKSLFLKYSLWTFVSVIVAFLLEMLLVAPEISATYGAPSRMFTMEGVVIDGFYVLLRDISFATVTFTTLAMNYYRKRALEHEIVLLEEYNMIEAKRRGKDTTLCRINLNAVSYCQQNDNFTQIHLVDGQVLYRDGTLRNFVKLICNHHGVQISRNVIVPYKNIKSFNQSGVVVKSSPQNVILSFTSSYQQNACIQIMQNTGKLESGDISRALLPKQQSKSLTNNQRKQQRDILLEYISKHPNCSAADIKKNRRISQSTVNRILAQLKKEGLIEYVGSKKTGGYKVVEGLRLRVEG
jgi:hypothetical protein